MRLRAVLGDVAGQEAEAVVRIVTVRRRRRGDDELGLLAAAGPATREALAELLALTYPGGLPPGRAVPTTAGDLPARIMIHTCVPSFALRDHAERLLASAYRATLAAADDAGARSVALVPFGLVQPYWPVEVATRVALTTLPNTVTRVREVLLVVRTPAALDVLAEALARR